MGQGVAAVRGVFVIAGQEVKNMMREKSLLLIVLLEVILLSSSSLISVGYDLMINPSQSSFGSALGGWVSLGVVTESEQEIRGVCRRTNIKCRFYEQVRDAAADLDDSRVDAVVVGSIDFENPPSYLTVLLPDKTPKSGVIRLSLKRFFSEIEGRLRKDYLDQGNLEVDVVDYEVPYAGFRARSFEVYLVFTLPLLVFMPALISGNLVMDSLTQDMESRNILNLLSAPVSDFSIIFGKALAAVIVSTAQIIVWIGILDLFLLDVKNTFFLVAAGVVYSFFYVSCGAVLALWFRKMRPTQAVYTLIILGSMMMSTPLLTKHPNLIPYSPAYILSHLASGENPVNFLPQTLVFTGLVLVLFLLINKTKRNLTII
ncbi:MAG: hypothetical protein GF334_11545 [Candidatus Altiarchaeales archaeon]|nr:hypothetical protein [Candidatus Altiarchaeales archaeon]